MTQSAIESKTQSRGEIRPATVDDITAIYNLTLPYVKDEILLPRSVEQITHDIDKTWVYIDDQNILRGTVTLVFFQPDLCEVRALVVDRDYRGYNIGRDLVKSLVDFILQNTTVRPMRLFALTYVPQFFVKSGFTLSNKEKFPEKIYEVCRFCARNTDCREIAVEMTIHES